MDAAVKVIASEGVHGATTRKIAAEVGVNLATLHYHFESKEAVLLNVLSHLIVRSRAQLSTAFGPPQDLVERIDSLLSFIWREVQESPYEQVTLFDLTLYALTTNNAEWLAKRKYDEYLVLYRDALDQARDVQDGSQTTDVEELANVIFTGFVGILLQWLATQDTGRADRAVKRLIVMAQAMAR